jgi:hypothetical protein
VERLARLRSQGFDPVYQDSLEHSRRVKARGKPKQLDQRALAQGIAVVKMVQSCAQLIAELKIIHWAEFFHLINWGYYNKSSLK